MKGLFEEVKLVKPQASRQKSSEMYLLALGLKKAKECAKQKANLHRSSHSL